MFQRSQLIVLILDLIFIDIKAKVTKACDQVQVALISGLQNSRFYLPPLPVYAIDDVVLGRRPPKQVQKRQHGPH